MIRITIIQDAITIYVVVAGIDGAVGIGIDLAVIIFAVAIAIGTEGFIDVALVGDAVNDRG